ncbi:uncharacterized protein [Cicer arietinum]|uniref:uncharacterized protein isoform X8 n=1 Tax=Cicer arietinum TaxID=3827 RepID=UPI003CC6278C
MANMYSSINFLFYEIENNFKGGLTFIFYSSKSLQIHNIYLLHFLYVFCACHWESIRVWVCRGTRGRESIRVWVCRGTRGSVKLCSKIGFVKLFVKISTVCRLEVTNGKHVFQIILMESIRIWVCRGTRGRLWFAPFNAIFGCFPSICGNVMTLHV